MKTVVSVLFGVASALALFLVMHGLISEPPGLDPDPGTGPVLLPFHEIPPEDERKKDRRKPPDPPEQPPRLVQTPIEVPAPEPVAPFPPLDIPDLPSHGDGAYFPPPGRSTGPDRDVSCSVMVPARYPRQQLVDGVEGWVEMHFTVMPDGSIGDAVVVASDPPRVFDREALRAIYRWRCEAGIVEGVAVPRRASQTMQFRIEQ